MKYFPPRGFRYYTGEANPPGPHLGGKSCDAFTSLFCYVLVSTSMFLRHPSGKNLIRWYKLGDWVYRPCYYVLTIPLDLISNQKMSLLSQHLNSVFFDNQDLYTDLG